MAASDTNTAQPAPPSPFKQALAQLTEKVPKPAEAPPKQPSQAPSPRTAEPESPLLPPQPKPEHDRVWAAIRRQQTMFEEQQKAMKADLEELQRFREVKAQAKKAPNKVLELFGMDQDEFTAAMANGEMATPEREDIWKVQEEVKGLRSDIKKEWEEIHKKQAAQEIDKLRLNVQQLLTSSEKYELASLEGPDAILNEIGTHWQNTFDEVLGAGEALSEQQAADLVEQRLEQKLEKLLNTKKAKSHFAKLGAPQLSHSEPSDPAPNTLTGLMSAETSPDRPLTAQERRALAIQLISKGKSG